MKPQDRDTHPDAEAAQIALLQTLTNAQRFQMVRKLSQQTIQLARRAIRRANPDASERELAILFLSLHYGEDLAQRVQKYLESRDEPR